MNNKDKHTVVHAIDTGCILYPLLHLVGWMIGTRLGAFIVLTLLYAAGAIYPVCCIHWWCGERDYGLGPILISLFFGIIPATINMTKIFSAVPTPGLSPISQAGRHGALYE